jgi:hypothetical protein
MYREYQQRAQAAMQMAIAAPADERHVWVQIAWIWQFLSDAKNSGTTCLRRDAPTYMA